MKKEQTIDFSDILHELDLIKNKTTLQTIDTGWINTNDWTNRHLGSINLNYNNLVGAFQVGEIVTEAVSGYTGIIMTDSGAILVLKNVEGGFFTNGRGLTGITSGATADVNGNTKNVDTNFYHEFGKNLSQMLVILTISTDGTENNAYRNHNNEYTSGGVLTERGITMYQIDTNNIKMQTGSDGAMVWFNDAGGSVGLNTENYFYKIICYFWS